MGVRRDRRRRCGAGGTGGTRSCAGQRSAPCGEDRRAFPGTTGSRPRSRAAGGLGPPTTPWIPSPGTNGGGCPIASTIPGCGLDGGGGHQSSPAPHGTTGFPQSHTRLTWTTASPWHRHPQRTGICSAAFHFFFSRSCWHSSRSCFLFIRAADTRGRGRALVSGQGSPSGVCPLLCAEARPSTPGRAGRSSGDGVASSSRTPASPASATAAARCTGRRTSACSDPRCRKL